MASNIHPSAVIEHGAVIGNNCTIGPFCYIGPDVTLGDNNILHSHVSIAGFTTIGNGNDIYPFASLGHKPQDLKYYGEKSYLHIGHHNTIREHATMNPGTEGGGLHTHVGDNSLFMMGSHVAHDCVVGNNVIMANNATIAGHVVVEDYVIMGGISCAHQFVKIGKHSMIGFMGAIDRDLPPFCTAIGERSSVAGLNITGLQRHNFSKDDIRQLRHAFQHVFKARDQGTITDQAKLLYHDDVTHNVHVKQFLDFIIHQSERGIIPYK